MAVYVGLVAVFGIILSDLFNYGAYTLASDVKLRLSTPIVRIGTRGSPLALAQAHQTKKLLEAYFSELRQEGAIEVQKIMTTGDFITNQALSEIGGKGLFTKELDSSLLENKVDICVHSMKDVPTVIPDGTVLPCMLRREETNDVFISKKYKSLSEVPNGSVIGSASLRRQAQLLSMNPSWKVINFRGNVQTRLNKIEKGAVDGTMLALAGLKRLNMTDIINSNQILTQTEMLPAVAQGAIGIQCRSNDDRMLYYLSKLNHEETRICVECERSFLASLDGNCRTPIAGQCILISTNNHNSGNNNNDNNNNNTNIGPKKQLYFKGMISKPNGKDVLYVTRTSDSVTDYKELGRLAGQDIINMAGDRFHEYHDAMHAINNNNNSNNHDKSSINKY